MRCNIKNKQLPAKCPKCRNKLKSEKCKCGHQVCQEEKKLMKRKLGCVACLMAKYIISGKR